MIGVCHMLMGMKEEALVWMHREVEMRVRIYGDWNPRTQMAQQLLAKALGGAEAAGAVAGAGHYSMDLVRQEEIVWDLNPFTVDDQFRVSAVLRMFEALGLVSRCVCVCVCVYVCPSVCVRVCVKRLGSVHSVQRVTSVCSVRVRSSEISEISIRCGSA